MKVFESQKVIAASSREVFKSFENQTLLEKWWGPEGFTTTSNAFEFKPKGIWKFVMHGPDGKNYPNEMVFQEIAAPHKLVMRHSVEPYFTLTVTIEDSKSGSVINWHQNFDSEEVARSIEHVAKPANVQILDKLETLVTKS